MAAYTTGSASSYADLLSAFDTFVTANGWTSSAGAGTARIFQKAGATFRMDSTVDDLQLIGATGVGGGTTTGDAPYGVKICSPGSAPLVFPVTYSIHTYAAPDEVYMVVNYGGDKHQHLNFGVSDIPGIGGTGAWFTGTARADLDSAGIYGTVFMSFGPNYFGTFITGFNLGYFLGGWSNTSYIHCALEGAAAWRSNLDNSTIAGNMMGQDHLAGLLSALPSQFNEAEVLLPSYGVLRRTDDTATIVAVQRNARFLRMDNVTPGEVITYGPDQWRCYPLYAKNTVTRDGVNWPVGAQHSGTLGIAIRYAGV